MKRNLRHHRRVPARLPATIEIPSGEKLQADVANLSRTGVMLECDRQTLEILHPKSGAGSAPLNAIVSFIISDPTTGTVKIESACGIVYARRLSRDVFHVGLAFKNLHENLIPHLEQYINAHRES